MNKCFQMNQTNQLFVNNGSPVIWAYSLALPGKIEFLKFTLYMIMLKFLFMKEN